ncbi:dystonin-like [Watersipora subatra]|uniref:dystonin-like n=1 Tax=Watersipora subatra TaxID=2589382 RepID=UPI00355BDA2F
MAASMYKIEKKDKRLFVNAGASLRGLFTRKSKRSKKKSFDESQVTDVVLPGQHEHSVRQSLLQWSQQTTSSYPIKITDFSRCWRDGKAFLYLIHRNRPELVNMRQVASNTSQENLELAFATAEKELGVTRLLDPEDMQVDQPDEKSVITYVASLYNVFPLPSPTKSVHDNDLASKTSEYEDLAKPLLLWLKEQTARCTSREFSATLVEVKSDIADFQKFHLEDIPAKLAKKRRLEILFHEIEPVTLKKTMIGQFPLDEQIHIDSITQHWDRFMSVVNDRERALKSEFARLQRLQKLAEKVHKDTKLCEGYLDDVEQRLMEELSRYESIHPLDAKDNCAVLQQVFNKIDTHIQGELTDVQNLKDGRYHQADNMYKRVLSVHQRLEGLMNRLQTELVPKIRSIGTSVSGTALTSPYRLSSSSVGSGTMSPASTSMSAASSVSLVIRQQSSSLSTTPLADGTSDSLPQSSPRTPLSSVSLASPNTSTASLSQASQLTAAIGSIPHSQSMMTPSSGAEMLKECIEWVEKRRKLLDPATLEFTSLGKLESTVQRLRAEHEEVIQFKLKLESCHQSRSRMPRDEVQAFTQWLTRVEGAYSSILGISSQQLQQCETLLEFARDSTDELRWLNEKEEEELTRNWNATTMNADVMKEHFQVFLWKKKRLMDDLQQHEKQFNDVQDRGEDIVRQKAIGSSMCQSYLTAMQERWGWLLQVLSCIDIHLKNAQAYNQFSEDVDECSAWLTEQTMVLNSEFNRSNINIEEGDKLMKQMQAMQNSLAHYEQVVHSLQDRQSFIVPLKIRSTVQKHPVPVNALCTYSQDDFLMEKGEECILLDNKDPQKWRVRNSRAAAGVVPSICLTFPPPDGDSRRQVQLLEDQFQVFIKLWKEKQNKLKLDMVFATAQIVRHWDVAKMKSLGTVEREAIMKALNSDTQRLLAESTDISEHKQAKLRETLQKCNDHYVKLNKKLRDKESKEPQSVEEKTEETMVNISYTLRSLDEAIKARLTEPIARDMEALQRQSLGQKAVEEDLAQVSEDIESLRRTGLKSFHNNNNYPLTAKQQNLSDLSATYLQRLETTRDMLEGLKKCSDTVYVLERRISPLETVTNDVNKLSEVGQQLQDVKEELIECRPSMLKLEEVTRHLRQLVERSRPDVSSHPDVEKLERDVSQVINKWQHLTDDTETRLKNVDKSLEILTLYSRHSRSNVEDGHGGSQSSISPREMFAHLQERGSTLNRISKSRATSRSVKAFNGLTGPVSTRMEVQESTSSLPKSTSGGALKLLDDLDELASLLGTDMSRPRVWKSQTKTAAEQGTLVTTTKVQLGRVSSSKNGEKLSEAIESGRLDTTTGTYTDVSNTKCKLAEALERELINPDSAAFVNPESGEVMDIYHAITHGFMQRSGHYMDLHSGKRLKLNECLHRYIIVPRDVDCAQKIDDVETDNAFVPPLDLSEKHVVEVLDPSTGEWIPVSVSIARGIYNANTKKYFNMKTGELLTSQEAAQRNMVKLGDKLLESSIDSTDTDMLLEGHIKGLKGKDINYSGEILSDDDNEDEDFLFTSSPRKEVPERPVWPGDGAQAILGANSPLSTAALTSGSHDDMVKVVNESGEATPTDVREADSHEKVDGITPNHELESFGSNSSFVVTQSITVYEHQQASSQHLATQTTQKLMSMIATGEVRGETTSRMFLEESDSMILTANTSDVTLDLSNVTSGDTTHEEVTFPTPPPPIAVKTSETEVLSHGSSTTSDQSSIFTDNEAIPPEVTGSSIGFSIKGTVPHTDSFSEDASAVGGEQSFPVSPPMPIHGEKPKVFGGYMEDSASESVTVIAAEPVQLINADNTTPEDVETTSLASMTMSQGSLTPATVPIVSTLLQTMHRTLSTSAPDESSASTSYRQASIVNVDATHISTNETHTSTFTSNKSDENTFSVKKKIGEKVTPNLVTSLTKHLEDKKSIIARTESASSRPSSVSGSYTRTLAKAPTQKQESESATPTSPSLKQLSQQLAVEAVQQRNSIKNRDGLMVSGLVKPSQRVANWRELEKQSIADNRTKPTGSSFQLQKKSTTPGGDRGVTMERLGSTRASVSEKKPVESERVATEETTTAGSLDADSQPEAMHKDNNNNLKRSLSAELLAKVDAALESFETDVQFPNATSERSPTRSLTPGVSIDSSSTSLSGRPTSADDRRVFAKSPDGAQSKVMEEVISWQEKARTPTKERTLSPAPNKLANVDSKFSGKVTFTYDPSVKRHKVTVYEHAKTISYEIAVKLGLVNIKTGRFRTPGAGALLSVRQACLQGFIDDNLPAITDIQTGHMWNLKQCVEQRLIDLDTGRVSDTVLRSMQISVPNSYIPSLVVIPPSLNIMDAVKVGLLNPHTGQFFYTMGKERLSCTLEKAIAMKYIHGEATLVQNPQTQKFHFLSEAIKMKLVDGTNGNILDIISGLMYMTFYGALLCGVYRSVYDASSMSVLQSTTGQPVSINESIATSLLGHNTCIVYDPEQRKQVSFDEALTSGIINKKASSYVNKKTSTSFSCEKAVEYGLIEPVSPEVCIGFTLSDCVESHYPPPSESHRAITQADEEVETLKADMNAAAKSTHRKQPVVEPEIIA